VDSYLVSNVAREAKRVALPCLAYVLTPTIWTFFSLFHDRPDFKYLEFALSFKVFYLMREEILLKI